MTTPVMVDLCCGAGAVAMGYDDAGFTVVGVDINPQPRFPFCFIQADVTELDLPALIEETGASAVHASPPCQLASRLRHYQPDTINERYPGSDSDCSGEAAGHRTAVRN